MAEPLKPRTRSPFPGMDPYLEQYWDDVHHRLCTYGCDMLRKNLPAGLISRLDERTIIEDDDAEERTIVSDVRVVDRGGLESGGLMSGGLISGGLISGGLALLEAPPATEPIVIEIKHEPVTEGFIQVIDTRNGGRIITVIDYTKAPVPILAAGDAEWASTISKTENV